MAEGPAYLEFLGFILQHNTLTPSNTSPSRVYMRYIKYSRELQNSNELILAYFKLVTDVDWGEKGSKLHWVVEGTAPGIPVCPRYLPISPGLVGGWHKLFPVKWLVTHCVAVRDQLLYGEHEGIDVEEMDNCLVKIAS
jgi:hypothetical protein